MASRHPIWLNLAPPARAPQPSEDMWPILRFISRLVRAIVPCGPRDRRSQIGQPTDDSATASLLQHQSGPPSPAPVVIEVEQVSQAQPKEETVSKAAYDEMKQHLEGIIKDLAQPKDDDTVSKAAYNDMKQHLEGIIKDLEEEMMILQAHVAGSLDTPRDAALLQQTLSTPTPGDFNLTPRTQLLVDTVSARRAIPEAQTPPPPPAPVDADADADAASEGSPAGSDTSQAKSPADTVSPSAHWISPAAERDSQASTSTGIEMPRIPLSECPLKVKSQWTAFAQKASGDMSHITPSQQVPSFSLSSENDSPVVIGMPNTVSKYKETSSVRVHSTPFEQRVDRTLSEMERFINIARAATSSPDEQGSSA